MAVSKCKLHVSSTKATANSWFLSVCSSVISLGSAERHEQRLYKLALAAVLQTIIGNEANLCRDSFANSVSFALL